MLGKETVIFLEFLAKFWILEILLLDYLFYEIDVNRI